MSKTNANTITENSKRKGVALNVGEALELLQSAIWHCQQNGIAVKFVNKPGVLWLSVAGAEMTGDGIRPVEQLAVASPEPVGAQT